jgi:integrase
MATRSRNVLVPLRAILEHAAVRRWCDRPAFDAPRQPPGRVQFLRPAEAEALVAAAAAHLRPLLIFLLTTGARMSEALELDWRNVDLRGQQAELVKTKTGRPRHVELVPRALAALEAMEHREGRVFRPVYSVRDDGSRRRDGIGYRDNGRTSGGQIKTAWAGACRRAGLPGAWAAWTDSKGGTWRRWLPELRPHDLRHTWATWHYAAHRDLLRLQAAGGWTGLGLVTRYAHLLPAAYETEARAWLGVKGRAPGARTAGRSR